MYERRYFKSDSGSDSDPEDDLCEHFEAIGFSMDSWLKHVVQGEDGTVAEVNSYIDPRNGLITGQEYMRRVSIKISRPGGKIPSQLVELIKSHGYQPCKLED